jgi:hypothetical protein
VLEPGNTLGTVIANTILLSLFGSSSDSQLANTKFNALRLVEDNEYQANFRQQLVAYVAQVCVGRCCREPEV